MTTKEATRHMFDRYQQLLEGLDFTGPVMTSASHLRWMCDQVDCDNWPIDKSSRWLGFIQGVLIMHEIVTVESERNYSRPLFSSEI
jgi:hypothetical protein